MLPRAACRLRGIVAGRGAGAGGDWHSRGARKARSNRPLPPSRPWHCFSSCVAIAAGVGAAILQIEKPGGLVRNTLWAVAARQRSFLLLVPALCAAAWLRWRYLERRAGENARLARDHCRSGVRSRRRWRSGSLLAQTIPGRHDAIDWPLPFRFAPSMAWRTEGGAQDILAMALSAPASRSSSRSSSIARAARSGRRRRFARASASPVLVFSPSSFRCPPIRRPLP